MSALRPSLRNPWHVGAFALAVILPLISALTLIGGDASRAEADPRFPIDLVRLPLTTLPLLALLMVSDLPRESLVAKPVRRTFLDLLTPLATAAGAGYLAGVLAVYALAPARGIMLAAVLGALVVMAAVLGAWIAMGLLVRVRLRQDGDALVACFFTWVAITWVLPLVGHTLHQNWVARQGAPFSAVPPWRLAFDLAEPGSAASGFFATMFPGEFSMWGDSYRELFPTLYAPWLFALALALWVALPLLLAAAARQAEPPASEVSA